MKEKTTILIAHPDLDNSIFNKHLADTSKKNDDFFVHHLDKNRTNGYFDLEKENKILKMTKALVWQFPIYWYNCPGSLRDWQDQVMSPIVYSADNFLKGIPVQVVFTAGAGAENYSHTGLNRYTAEEMLRPLEMTANASGMVWKRPLGFYGCNPEESSNLLKRMEKEFLEAMAKI